MNKKHKIHHPPHLYLDNNIYFVTARTIAKKKYFNTDEKKNLIKRSLIKALNKYQFKIYGWVILSNHYHLLLKILKGADLSNFIRYINSRSAVLLRQQQQTECQGLALTGRGVSPDTPAKNKQEIWYNYHDRCIRNETDFFKHLNYIHNQPIKHGYVKNYNHLNEYQFSSFQHYLKSKGQKWLDQCFEDYPIADFSIDE